MEPPHSGERGVSFLDEDTGEVSRPGTGQPIASRPVSSRPASAHASVSWGVVEREVGSAEGFSTGVQAPAKTQDVLVEQHQKTEHGETMRLLSPGSDKGSRGSRGRRRRADDGEAGADGDAPAEEEMPPEAGFRGARYFPQLLSAACNTPFPCHAEGSGGV